MFTILWLCFFFWFKRFLFCQLTVCFVCLFVCVFCLFVCLFLFFEYIIIVLADKKSWNECQRSWRRDNSFRWHATENKTGMWHLWNNEFDSSNWDCCGGYDNDYTLMDDRMMAMVIMMMMMKIILRLTCTQWIKFIKILVIMLTENDIVG